jgi:ATP-binding cassette subfamily B (MDR/TAP) protein 1
MQMCSRILVCAEGRIVEDGSYQDLIARRGYFAELNRGGEWE